jgi:uridine kinase
MEALMAVENKILKIKKRTGALTPFDRSRVQRAVLGAAKESGGFKRYIIEESMYRRYRDEKDEFIAEAICDDIIMCLNNNPSFLSPNFPPTVEDIQNTVVHVLRSRGFIDIADRFEIYRFSRIYLRAGVKNGGISEEELSRNDLGYSVISKAIEWNKKNNCSTISDLNKIVSNEKKFEKLIKNSMSFYESSLDQAAQAFLTRHAKEKIRLFFVSGPSSSGKTTTTEKIKERLVKKGINIATISVDDFFYSLGEHPMDWFKDHHYETPFALDLEAINDTITRLLKGEPVVMPRYNFKTGMREDGDTMKIDQDQVVFLDSLHGLYRHMTIGVPDNIKFKLYIEAFNSIYEGDGSSNVISGHTDIRMLRRMLRDYKHRNHDPIKTAGHWHYVREGDLRYILPYMGTADFIVNGGLAFDLPVLKAYSKDLFPKITDFSSERLDSYLRVKRIRKIFETIADVPVDTCEKLIPADCHIREFIGGSYYEIPHNE